MRQYVRWRTHMSQIRPYYAVRCNSSPTVIEVLATLGTGFICTNKVLPHMLAHCIQYTLLRLSMQESENSFFFLRVYCPSCIGYSPLSHSG